MICPLLLLSLMLSVAFAGDWPQWRGPLLNGSTPETNLKARFSQQADLLGSTPMPDRSGATPVVFGDAIFVPSPDAQKSLLLLCVDRVTGKAVRR